MLSRAPPVLWHPGPGPPSPPSRPGRQPCSVLAQWDYSLSLESGQLSCHPSLWSSPIPALASCAGSCPVNHSLRSRSPRFSPSVLVSLLRSMYAEYVHSPIHQLGGGIVLLGARGALKKGSRVLGTVSAGPRERGLSLSSARHPHLSTCGSSIGPGAPGGQRPRFINTCVPIPTYCLSISICYE